MSDGCVVQGHHQTLIYGHFGQEMRPFCRLDGIEVVT
jgi:hypothetical protein